MLSGESDVAEEEATLKTVFARRAEELRQALARGREWLGGIQDDLAERLAALATCSPARVPVWAERPPPLVSSLTSARKDFRMDAAQPQRDDPQREAVILLPSATPSVLPAAAPSPGLPAQRAASTPPTVPLPEAVPTVTVGSRAEVVFGRDEHIALSRVRSRTRRSRGYGEPLKRRLPVSEREIPSLTESEATGAEEQNHQVTMRSLWDLLVAPTSASGATTPLLFPRSSDQRHAPHQSPLWE